MKVAAVGNTALKKETSDKGIPPGVEWAWVDSVEALAQYPGADCYFDLDFTPDASRIGRLGRLLPKPVIINSVVHSLQEIGLPFIRINAWPGFLGRKCCELAVLHKVGEEEVRKIFGKLGWAYRIVADIPGMISARILSMVINEAYYTLQDRVSTKPEIDTAMRLGTNYPFGPFEWSERIGLSAIDELLTVLSRTETRYKAAGMLKGELEGLKSD
jgi:3-hydroxybutyryl-CoA dehydrogenase